MRASSEILHHIRRVAPAHQDDLNAATRAELLILTDELRRSKPSSAEELDRYLAIREREFAGPAGRIADQVRGRSILVTGGSGCLGTALLQRLRGFAPGRLISMAITPAARPVPGVEYLAADVRRPDAVQDLLRSSRPDIVFHLAAQRDPGLAEQRILKTIATNVLGTRNVARAAADASVQRFVYASTGKALRPFTSDVYASTKRVGEGVMARSASDGGMACSGVRFTHVVDNSILLRRLARWCRQGEPIRLHSPETMFYAQSARESAQLMLVALLAPADATFRLHMIRDLGWPVSALDLALGMMQRERARAPLYVAGHDPGYEETPYPGLYDLHLAGDVSPLMNGLEAHRVEGSASAAVDAVPVPAPDHDAIWERLAAFEHTDRGRPLDEPAAHQALDDLAWDLLRATTRATAPGVLQRMVKQTACHRPTMGPEHLRMDDLFRRHASAGAGDAESAVAGRVELHGGR